MTRVRPMRVFFKCKLASYVSILLLSLICNSIAKTGSPRWWSIVNQISIQTVNRTMTISTKTGSSLACSRIPGLDPQQIRFCKKYKDLMLPIAYGTHIGLEQCKSQFQERRWNCSSLNNVRNVKVARALRRKGILGGVLETGSRESAFVHAITAAGLVYSVSKFCSSENSKYCGCGDNRKLHDDSILSAHEFRAKKWKWAGCSDSIDFGAKVCREFANAGERGKSTRALMNSHNNIAGIKAVRDNRVIKCKCHGVSGSCELETCWWSIRSFKEIGNILKDKYDGAYEMKEVMSRGVAQKLVPAVSSNARPKEDELLYYEPPPNFCDRDARLGVYGTQGRVCNGTSSGIDGCELLCCGRGFTTVNRTRTEQCHCVFHWCCTVSCQTCIVDYTEHICL